MKIHEMKMSVLGQEAVVDTVVNVMTMRFI